MKNEIGQMAFSNIKIEQKCKELMPALSDISFSQLNCADHLCDACIGHPPLTAMDGSRVHL